ncbi:hypothetical protein Dimus_000394 [Dionaea muscipula]
MGREAPPPRVVDDSRKREKQQISVPFLWEDKPGMPKKDWKQKAAPPPPPPPHVPAKFVVSVPFKWEQKPGTPLRCFQQESPEMILRPHLQADHKPLPLPPAAAAYYYKEESDDEEEDNNSFYALCGGAGDRDRRWWDLDLEEVLSMQTQTSSEESFTCASSLLANGLVPTWAISSAVPLENKNKNIIVAALIKHPRGQTEEETHSSPETSTGTISSNSSSYATATATATGEDNMSLVGVPFLRQLFPLYSPNAAGHSDDHQVRCPPDKQLFTPDYQHTSIAITRPITTTLGDLIMHSRRMSSCCSKRKAAVQMRKQSISKKGVIEKRTSRCCCMFQPGDYSILAALGKLLEKKNVLMLKVA